MRWGQILHISTLKCVDYDADFQQFLTGKYPSFVPKPKAKKGSKKNTDTGSATPSRAKKNSSAKNNRDVETGEKRKRRNRKRAQDNEEDEEEGEDKFDELVYRPRGTRSRPGNHLNYQ